mmetsp:Transcript_3897/g.8946  ORF Transcript_3897/g.8946 Transcript_3897/m.8946 type:complete len:269 (-) Transcript_3897:151-957(-)
MAQTEETTFYARKMEQRAVEESDSEAASGTVSSSEGEAYKGPVSAAEAHIRMGFVRKVYAILSVQLVITALIATPFALFCDKFWVKEHIVFFYLALAGSVAAVCAISCCQQAARTFPTNYALLFTFTVFESIVVGFVISMYTLPSILLALAATSVTFFSLTVYACTTKSDFTGMGPYLYAGLLALMGFGFVISMVSMFAGVPSWMTTIQALFGVLLFSFYIVYDTQLIMGGNSKHSYDIDDYVFAALNLYLDIINLFLYMLELMGSRD